MTQDDLAAKSGVDQTHVSSIEIGRRLPSDDVKKRLAKALGIRPSRLRFSEAVPDAQNVADVDDRPGHTSKPGAVA